MSDEHLFDPGDLFDIKDFGKVFFLFTLLYYIESIPAIAIRIAKYCIERG